MSKTPAFFVPAATSENQEQVYANFAKWCNAPVPKQSERVYSITFVHDDEQWTATVGMRLQGVRRHSSRSQGKKVMQTTELSDQATVLSIFPDNPFKVVTNQGIVEHINSAWENPFFVGRPNSILYFSLTNEES